MIPKAISFHAVVVLVSFFFSFIHITLGHAVYTDIKKWFIYLYGFAYTWHDNHHPVLFLTELNLT